MVNADGSPLDGSLFNFDAATNKFSIVASDINDVNDYPVKIIASFTEVNYSQESEHDVTVLLRTNCESTTLTNPG